VRVGDPVTPISEFSTMDCSKKTYLAKAFDDRPGWPWLLLSCRTWRRSATPMSCFGVATVMEEVGVRGATTSVEAVNPDVAIVVDVDIAGDVPGIKPEESSIKWEAAPRCWPTTRA